MARGIGMAIVYVFVFILCAGLVFGSFRNARVEEDTDTLLSYSNLNYDITTLDNGDVRIKQTVTVNMQDRGRSWRQLFQKYQLRQSDLTNITGISVKDVTSGDTYTRASFKDVDTDRVSLYDWDSVAAKTWYLRDINTNEDITDDNGLSLNNSESSSLTATERSVELGWNIPRTDSGVQIFEIEMTWKNVSTALRDGAYSKIELISDDNSIPIDNLSGSITYSSSSTRGWLWMHYSGNGRVKKESEQKFTFSAKPVKTNEHVDFVMLYQADDAVLSQMTRQNVSGSVEKVISQERQEYNDAISAQRGAATARIAIFGLSVLVAIILTLWLIYGAITTRRYAQYHGDVIYFREPVPVSPAAAAQIYAVLKGENYTDKKITNRALSATMLSLMSKKAIYILPGDASQYQSLPLDFASSANLDNQMGSLTKFMTRGEQAGMSDQNVAAAYQTISQSSSSSSRSVAYVLSQEAFDMKFASSKHLSASEAQLLNVLLDIATERNTLIFSDRDIKKVAKKYNKRRATTINNMYMIFRSEFTQLAITKTSFLLNSLPTVLAMIYLAFAIVAMNLMGSYFAGFIITGLMVAGACGWLKGYGSRFILRDRDNQLVGQVKGLAQYLEDFSDFSDRGIEEMKLWDRYLVYAAAFGMSDKVARAMRQTAMNIAVNNPEAMDDVPYYPTQWMWMPHYHSTPMDVGSTNGYAMNSPWSNVGPDFSSMDNFMSSFNSSLNNIQSDFNTATVNPATSSGSSSFGGSGGSFGGSGGGAGGGSFGGR
ncbi:DUF2207 domain-containing protein [Alloscardovia theropitheci]|nr:DUF2207 domain-containing protein [Alloscardovia theropitheci]